MAKDNHCIGICSNFDTKFGGEIEELGTDEWILIIRRS